MKKKRLSRPYFIILIFAGLVIAFLAVSLILQLEFPKATGPYTVGRTQRIWVDRSRVEELGEKSGQYREAPVIIWYPAKNGSGTPAAYVPDLARLEKDLPSSGDIPAVEVFALRFIRDNIRENAQMASDRAAYPVILLSPGNDTNVEFYAGIAEELASFGFIVVGINHPYDVAAVALQDGTIARFAAGPDSLTVRPAWIAKRIAIRTQDVFFVFNQLKAVRSEGDAILSGHMELAHTGVMGHSLGGISAAQACLAEGSLKACLNFDGLQRGGPFSADANPTPPAQAFMFITKETQLPPASLALFKTIAGGSYLVTLPGANHDNFTDGPLLMPGLLPLSNDADRNLSLIRAYSVAFFEQTLEDRPSVLLEKPVKNERVSVEIFTRQR